MIDDLFVDGDTASVRSGLIAALTAYLIDMV